MSSDHCTRHVTRFLHCAAMVPLARTGGPQVLLPSKSRALFLEIRSASVASGPRISESRLFTKVDPRCSRITLDESKAKILIPLAERKLARLTRRRATDLLSLELAHRDFLSGFSGAGALKCARPLAGSDGEIHRRRMSWEKVVNLDEMIEQLAGWVAPHGGALQSWLGSVNLRPSVMVLLIVAGTLALVYGRSLCSLVASAPAVAWLLSRENDSEKKNDKKQQPVQAPRAHALDDAIGRRWARAEFYRNHKNFDHNCPPQSDAAKGLTVTETYVLNSKGVEVFVKSWVPADAQLHGVIFLCHGYGDSVIFYAEGVARTLALAGYAVYGMDYPGFGMSEGLHGHIPNFDKLVDDVIEQYRIIKGRAELKGLPCFLFGESMGGAVALRAHLKEPTMWDGAVLVAPMCKIADAMYPPWILVQILIALSRIIPKAKLVPGNDIAAIGFRDPEKKKIADLNPVAYVGNPRLGTAVQLLRVTDFLESKLQEVSLPLLVLHGGGDQVTDPAISKLLHEKAKSTDKTLRLYDDAWHCLLQGEPDQMIHVIMKDVISWLDAHAATKTSFPRLSDGEFEERVAGAVPSLINFGRFNVATQASW